jgi:hypothetical protein
MSIACPVLEMRAMAALMIPQPSSTYGINGDAFLKQGWDRTQPLTVDRISNHILYNYALPGALPSCPTHVQGMVIPLDARLLPAPGSFDVADACPVMFPYKDEMDFKSVVPDDDMINGYLLTDWGNMLSLTEADPVGLLKHLPKEMDQVAHRQRAIQWECPIQMDVSTSSYVDAKKRQVTHTPTPYPDPRALSQPYPNPRITIGRTATPSLSCNGGTCSPSCATTTTDGSILMSTQPRCAPLCCAPLCCAPLHTTTTTSR